MTHAARRSGSAGAIALLIASLILVLWATLAPRNSAGADGATGTAVARFCFWCGDTRVSDAIANVVLFLPIGFALVFAGLRLRRACVLCLLLTLGIEATQYVGLPAGRMASVSDALTNALGGALGASLAHWRNALRFPRAALAARLAGAWTLLCALLFIATAWAVSPPTTSVTSAGAETPARTSPFPVAPGFGWFHGTIIGTLVDGVELPHHGTGPAIVEVPAASRRTARIALTGRDERTGVVPFLFLHAPHDVRPELLLAQRGSAAVLRASTRSSGIGLTPLETAAPDAFDAGSMGAADTTLVTARLSPRELSLVVERSGHRWEATGPRALTVGWALVQSLVSVSAPSAVPLTALWLLLLSLPIGYWGWWAGKLRAYVILGAAVVVAIAIVAAVQSFEIAFPPLWQWCTLAGGVAFGMLLGQVTLQASFPHHHGLARD